MTPQRNLLSSKWMSNLSKDERDKFEIILRNDTAVLTRLSEIVEDYLNELDSSELKESDFDNPSWALKQASRLGERRGLNKIKELLKFLNNKE